MTLDEIKNSRIVEYLLLEDNPIGGIECGKAGEIVCISNPIESIYLQCGTMTKLDNCIIVLRSHTTGSYVWVPTYNLVSSILPYDPKQQSKYEDEDDI